MLLLILDPWYKSLQIIQDYVGLKMVMQNCDKIWSWNFDVIILMPWNFNATLWLLNLNVGWFILGIFGYVASIDKSTMGLFKVELSLNRWVAC
jgi:hypothetical protein